MTTSHVQTARKILADVAYVVVFVLVAFIGSMVAHPASDTTPAPALVTTASVNYEVAMQSQISSISHYRHCVPVAAWPKHQIPAAMILQKADSYTVTSTVWTYPAPAGYWTRALCSK